jgi:uncharacterized protein
MKSLIRRGAVAAVAVLMTAIAGTAVARAATQTGYLTMADGVQIKYTAVLPSGQGPWPVVFTFDGYSAGVTGGSAIPGQTSIIVGNPTQLVAHGYVALGANVPGTGCSSGNFTMFSPDWGRDGAQIVEWAAHQPWSDGEVGMVGHSFGGFVTYLVAGFDPPNLRAIAPASTDGDFYGDAVDPGGIWNAGISEAFFAGQQNNAEAGVQQAIEDGDTECARNFLLHESEDNVDNSTIAQTMLHPWDDAWWQLRATKSYFPRIQVPVLATSSWQDGIAGSNLLDEIPAIDNARLWYIGGNGHHDEIDPTEPQLFQFLDHYLKGADNGWEQTPHIQLWQDDQLPSASASRVVPEWSVDIRNWPLRVRPFSLYLRSGNALSTAPPGPSEGADSYPYPRLAASTFGDDSTKNLDDDSWKLPFDHSGAVAYTTAPFPRDAVFAGSGSLDLWLASTATDTDLQATLTEVLPDGEEMYIQRGWLRAEDRALDARASTALDPVHPYQASDVEPLVPGRPTYMRLQIFPFSVAIRKGARLRLIIDAPTSATGVHIFAFDPTPATNTIEHDAAHRSVLVLGLLPGVAAGGPLPACDDDIGMPCRPDAFADEPVTHDPLQIPQGPNR